MHRPISLASTLAMLAIVALAGGPDCQASGGAKKPAHGSEAKKKSGGHSAPKKDAKSSGHGAPKGHGEKAETKDGESPISNHVADVEKILTMIAGKEKKHDPRLYTEVDLGQFRVTRPGTDDDEIFVVKFHVYGVLNEQDQPKFERSAEGRQQRLRDAVLSVVHRAEFDQLLDPALDAVKSDLVSAINRMLENDLLRDVAFSSFSMERN